MVCSKCGSYINKNFKHCPYCGENLPLNEYLKTKKRRRLIKYYFFILLILVFVKLFVTFFSTFTYLDLNSEKTDINKFKSYVEQKGCKLKKIQSDDRDEIISHYIADNSCNYQIEYLTISDEDLRNQYYNSLVKKIKYKNIPFLGIDNSDLGDYKEYSNRGLYYKSVSMLDDDIIYISTDIFRYKDFFKIKDKLGFPIDLDVKYLGFDLMFICWGMIILILIASWWKINTKFERKGWICLIPIYNVLCLGKDIFGKSVYGLLLLIPIVNIVAFLVFSYRLGKVFQVSDIVKLFLVLIPILYIPLVAFNEFCVPFSTN